MRCARLLALLLAAALSSGCIIARIYVGNELPPIPEEKLVPGTTTKAEVLRDFGPPDRLVRQYEGDVFVYAHLQRNVTGLLIEEPVITHAFLFSYTKEEEKSDRLVVMFDRSGVLTGVGFKRGTQQLDPF